MQPSIKIELSIFILSMFVGIGFSEGISQHCIIQEKIGNLNGLHQLSDMNTDWWPMYQHDLHNSGYSNSSAPETNSLLWTFKSEGYVHSPVVENGRIFFGTDKIQNPLSSESFLYCINLDGSELWKFETNEALGTVPSIADNKVYISGENGNIYCIDCEEGECIWIHNTNDQIVSSPKIIDNKVIICSLNRNIYCLNAESGKMIWTRRIGMDIRSTPAIVNSRIYVGNSCIDLVNGNLLWNSEIGVPLFSSPTVYKNTAYIGSIDELMYSYNIENGKKMWDHYIGSMVWECSPASAYDNIYVGNAFGYIYCLNATTSDEIWAVKKSSRSVTAPAISDGKVYIGSCDGNIYSFDAFTGETIWNYQSSEPITCSPAIADGKVFIGSGDTLFCFGEDVRFCSDLECTGTIVWSNVKPSSLVTSNFTIANIGKQNSQLDWKIESFPEWGNWTFSAMEGSDLEPNDGCVTVEVSAIAPNIKKDSFQGSVRIVNAYNSSDYGIINISMCTMTLDMTKFHLFIRSRSCFYLSYSTIGF